MNYQQQSQSSNIFLRPDGFAGGLTPLISPVARFTFDSWSSSGVKPVSHNSLPQSARRGTKISLKRDSSGKKKRVTFEKILRREFVSISVILMSSLIFAIDFQLFNPVVQMYDVNTWPSSLRLLSPIHIVILMVLSLIMAISGLILYPSGHTFLGALCLLTSFVITGGLAALAASVISKNKGAHGLNRLKLRA